MYQKFKKKNLPKFVNVLLHKKYIESNSDIFLYFLINKTSNEKT